MASVLHDEAGLRRGAILFFDRQFQAGADVFFRIRHFWPELLKPGEHFNWNLELYTGDCDHLAGFPGWPAARCRSQRKWHKRGYALFAFISILLQRDRLARFEKVMQIFNHQVQARHEQQCNDGGKDNPESQ